MTLDVHMSSPELDVLPQREVTTSTLPRTFHWSLDVHEDIVWIIIALCLITIIVYPVHHREQPLPPETLRFCFELTYVFIR